MSKELITERQKKAIWAVVNKRKENKNSDWKPILNEIISTHFAIFKEDGALNGQYGDIKKLSKQGAQKLIDRLNGDAEASNGGKYSAARPQSNYGDNAPPAPPRASASPNPNPSDAPKVKEKERAHMVQHDTHRQYDGQTAVAKQNTEASGGISVKGGSDVPMHSPPASVNTPPIDMMAFLKDVSSGKTTWSAIYYALPGVLEAVDRLYDAYKDRFTKGQFYTIFDVAMSYAKYGVSLSFVINSSHFIKGKTPNSPETLCFRATFYQALLSSSKLFKNLKHSFEGEGKTLKCVVSGVSVETNEPVEAEFAWQTADDSGYTKTTDKNGREYAKPLWKIQPKLMLRYRAYTFFIREHASVLLNGMYTKEELIDIENTK